ncbi:Hym1p [Sugiyamaella lignohabitans]|uniref:Hym1p n=1 Tax=Sugiyamaella lignohabitans TaxID=796027 RepID=A0A161HND3_9ASCO|nr:Hym1p [Sugiyamaella lignohabitans]ANB15637.1 Hym1p [Sugiyamaella lignohabitans]
MAHIINHRANYTFMTEYVDSSENLKLAMVLLRDKSKNIQYEAFNIFKVFVANPKKSKPVADILIKNKAKLLNYLNSFQTDRNEDDTFQDEKAFIITKISNLPSQVTPSASASAVVSRRTSPTPAGSFSNPDSKGSSVNDSRQPSPTAAAQSQELKLPSTQSQTHMQLPHQPQHFQPQPLSQAPASLNPPAQHTKPPVVPGYPSSQNDGGPLPNHGLERR